MQRSLILLYTVLQFVSSENRNSSLLNSAQESPEKCLELQLGVVELLRQGV
jgi:hypothetical protein